MGTGFSSDYGSVQVLGLDEIFKFTVQAIESAVLDGHGSSIGLTGGSTPKAFYDWAAEQRPFSDDVLERALWYTSDERMVPLESEESNFGEADRRMLTPLGVHDRNKHPWPVRVDPHSAARAFGTRWQERHGAAGFDLCLLGMGDDGHTASIFPESPLLSTPIPDLFTCVEVPDKGWRLTVSRAGLSRCRQILITVTGTRKASVLKEVLEGPEGRYPVQILKDSAERVTWLVDPEAAAELDLKPG